MSLANEYPEHRVGAAHPDGGPPPEVEKLLDEIEHDVGEPTLRKVRKLRALLGGPPPEPDRNELLAYWRETAGRYQEALEEIVRMGLCPYDSDLAKAALRGEPSR